MRDDPLRGAVIEGLSEQIVVDRSQTLALVARGESARHYGATRVNDASSRSHTLFRLVLESKVPTPPASQESPRATPSAKDGGGADGGGSVRVAYLDLVDLAGSERSDAAGASCACAGLR